MPIFTEKSVVWCEHTCPKHFLALHYEDSSEEELIILDRKITNKLALLLVGFLMDTLVMVVSATKLFFEPVSKLFTRKVEDMRCENCKKEGGAI